MSGPTLSSELIRTNNRDWIDAIHPLRPLYRAVPMFVTGRSMGKSTSYALNRGKLKMVYVPLPAGADRPAAENSWRQLAKDMFEKGPLYWADKMDAAKKSCPELAQFLREEIEKLQQQQAEAQKPKVVKGGKVRSGT